MAGAVDFHFTMRWGEFMRGLRVRTDRAYELANAATTLIAEDCRATFDSFYPPKVARTLSAVPVPSRARGKLLMVEATQRGMLRTWYDRGTAPHDEFAHLPPMAMHFVMPGSGDEMFLFYVHHPGAAARNKLPAVIATCMGFARARWTQAMRTGLGAE